MKIKDIITEARVAPDKNIMGIVAHIVDTANTEYQEFLDSHNDQDDIDELADMLNMEAEMYDDNASIEFHVNHEPRKDPNEYISAAASWEGEEDKHIDIILHAKNLEGTWGPKTFKEIMMKAIAHETIHFGQYDKMGKEKLGQTQSGHEKGTKIKNNGGTARDWERSYLRDPHELMAYGHDLAGEINDLDNPEQVLRSPEKYINDLPVYKKFRGIFHKESPQIKALLKYTANYM
jgi:hypothetical protein